MFKDGDALHIFIDESGAFAISAAGHAVSAVGGLIIPDQQLAKIERQYAAMRPTLASNSAEIKGRLLAERDIASVVAMLRRHEVLFEVSAIDMGMHDAAAIREHKRAQGERFTSGLTDDHHPGVRAWMTRLRERLEEISTQLYVQSVVTFDLIARIVEHGTMYFSQRRPQELAAFHWVIDAKNRGRITEWESWWSFVVMPMLQADSLRDGMKMFDQGDYSHFERFSTEVPKYLRPYVKNRRVADKATDVRKLMTESFRFSDAVEPGLELVDILVNATRRAMMGHLAEKGWRGIPELMIHRKQHYIYLVSLGPLSAKDLPYVAVLDQFRLGGKDMLAPRFIRR